MKLQSACCILYNEKPTAVRQAIFALHEVVHYKTELHPLIKEELSNIPYASYKDTMHPLTQTDIQQVTEMLCS